MNKTVVFIMGKSGCGKSTLERNLVTQFPALFRKVVSITTRPIREGEVDGRDYYYLNQRAYDGLRDEMVQVTSFAGHRYGSTESEYTTEHRFPILVAVPESVADFTPVLLERFPSFKIFNVYFNISDERLRQNMRSRGDTETMIEQRLLVDTLDDQFAQSGLTADFVVADEMLNEDLPARVQLAAFKHTLPGVS